MKEFLTKNIMVIVLILGLFNTALSVIAIRTASSNKIYTIGLNRLTDSFTKQLNDTSLSKEQQNAQVINFATGLEKSLNEFKANGRLLLMEEAVLSGGHDITDQVHMRIKNGM